MNTVRYAMGKPVDGDYRRPKSKRPKSKREAQRWVRREALLKRCASMVDYSAARSAGGES